MKTYEVKRGVDLRQPVEEKKTYSDADVVFLVNNSHTLVHVVFAWSEGNFRERVPGWLKGVHDGYLEKYLVKRYDWLLFGDAPESQAPPKARKTDFKSIRRYKRYLRVIK